MLKRIFFLTFLIVLLSTLTYSVEINSVKSIIGQEVFYSGFSKEKTFDFNKTIITKRVEGLMSVTAPDQDNLNVRFDNSNKLTDFNIIVNKRIDDTKFDYQFRLPSNNYEFNITIYGLEKGNDVKIQHSENSAVFQAGKLIIDFSDFYEMGLEGTPIRKGNDIVFQFSPDWNSLEYSTGDLVVLDPIFSYDFGGSGGVFAARCEGGASISEDGTFYYDQPCPASYLVITTDTDLDTSDANRIRVLNTASTDKGYVLFFFNISNATGAGLGDVSSLTFSWEGQQTTTTDPIELRIYNYGNTSYETCNTFELAGIGSDETHTCVRLKPVTDYFNSSLPEENSDFVSIALFTANDDASTSDTWTNYIFLDTDVGEGNSTFFESTTQVTDKFLNITFLYETNNSRANATIDSTFIYKPTPSNINTNTTSFIDSTNNLFYEFSYFPTQLNISVKSTIIYNNHGSQTRTFTDTLILHNSSFTTGSENLTLYLLPNADGIFVTFQVIDIAERPLTNVLVTANRSVIGKNVEIQRGITGSAGTTSFFLDPDISHTFIFSKLGFNTLKTNFAPTQTLYTITMGGGTRVIANQTNFYKGINYEFTPSQNSLFNGTDVDFSFNIISTFHPLNKIGFRLFNGTGTFLANQTCTGAIGAGCNATLIVNVGVNSSIVMNAFWDINGNVTNVTSVWSVFIVDNRTGIASFDNLKHDFKQLTHSFGSGRNAEFTKAIFAFLIILFTTGSLAFTTGIFSPLAILIYMFGIVFFLDVVGFLPSVLELSILGADPNFITILVGVMVFLALIIDQKQ